MIMNIYFLLLKKRTSHSLNSMFNSDAISRIFTMVCYIGFMVSGGIGFNTVRYDFNINILTISIVSFVFGLILFLSEFYIVNVDYYKLYYIRSIFLMIFGVLNLGISEIGLCFGILAMVTSITNLLMAIFSGKPQERLIEPH